MSNLTVNRQGPEVMHDNDRAYDVDYANNNREFKPPKRAQLDWRTYAVLISGLLAAYVVLFLIYSLWKVFYCWSERNVSNCRAINDREPFAIALLIFLPCLIIVIDIAARVWTRTRNENAIANRTNLVLNRYGDPMPADLYDRLSSDRMLTMLLAHYTSAAGIEERIAPHKLYPRGLNSLSLSNSHIYSDSTVVDKETIIDPLASLPQNGDDPMIKLLIQRGLIDRSGNSLLVGFSAPDKPHFIELDETGLIALAGMPQAGKSTTATLLLAQLALIDGSIVFVADKHGRKEKGLLNRLAPIAHTFEQCAIEPHDIIAAIDHWYEIGADRLAEDNTRLYPPCFIVIDEFTALVLLDILPAASLHRLLSGAVEFPKIQCHGVIIGHQWTGKLLGTFGAPMRRVCTQRLIHRIDPQDAGFLINSSAAKQVLSLPDGAAIFQGASQPSPIELRVPRIDVHDLEYIAQALPSRSVPNAANVSAVSAVPSASECDDDPLDAETVDPRDFATDPRTRVAKDLLSKRDSTNGWRHSYRQVQAITRLRTATIVAIAAQLGRGNGKTDELTRED
jgi:hypothetical protein